MKTRGSKDIRTVFEKYAAYLPVELIASVNTVNIDNTLYANGKRLKGAYIVNTASILVRNISNNQEFERVCLHELGHHAHHFYMPTWSAKATQQQKEAFANSFAHALQTRNTGTLGCICTTC